MALCEELIYTNNEIRTGLEAVHWKVIPGSLVPYVPTFQTNLLPTSSG
jgi:hypothetical protein